MRRWVARSFVRRSGRLGGLGPGHLSRVYLPALAIEARLEVDYKHVETLIPTVGTVSGTARNLVVALGNPVARARIEEFRRWPLDVAVPYRPEYLAGAFCESYDHIVGTIREFVRTAIRARGVEMAVLALRKNKDDPEAPTPRQATVRSSDETFRHVLVPVFIATTRRGDTVRQVIVNGIDGTFREDRWLTVRKFAFVAFAGGWFVIERRPWEWFS